MAMEAVWGVSPEGLQERAGPRDHTFIVKYCTDCPRVRASLKAAGSLDDNTTKAIKSTMIHYKREQQHPQEQSLPFYP